MSSSTPPTVISSASTSAGIPPASSAAAAASTVSSNSANSSIAGSAGQQQANVDREQIYQWILELSSPSTRETALLELSKKREVVPDLAPMLWHSFGTIAALLQEIINIYPAINPANLSAHQSNR